MAMDDELIEQAIEAGAKPSPRPSISDWSLQTSLLADIFDRLGELTATLVGVNGGKPKLPRPSPRPLTGRERVEGRRTLARHHSLVAEVREAMKR